MNSRKRSIRLYCLDCQSGSCKAVRLCESESCFLYEFRMGRVGKKTVQNALKTEKKGLGHTKLPILENNCSHDDLRAESFLKSLGHGKSMVEIERGEKE